MDSSRPIDFCHGLPHYHVHFYVFVHMYPLQSHQNEFQNQMKMLPKVRHNGLKQITVWFFLYSLASLAYWPFIQNTFLYIFTYISSTPPPAKKLIPVRALSLDIKAWVYTFL